jgi:hypothetical protein
VKVVEIGLGDVGRHAVLRSKLGVRVALGAGVWGLEAEEGCMGVGDVVDAVAVRTAGHIEVALLDEGLAVHALLELVEDLFVALEAGLLDNAAGELPARSSGGRRVGILRVGDVAGRAGHVIAAVRGLLIRGLAHEQAQLLSAGQRHGDGRGAMAGEAEVVGDGDGGSLGGPRGIWGSSRDMAGGACPVGPVIVVGRCGVCSRGPVTAEAVRAPLEGMRDESGRTWTGRRRRARRRRGCTLRRGQSAD